MGPDWSRALFLKVNPPRGAGGCHLHQLRQVKTGVLGAPEGPQDLDHRAHNLARALVTHAGCGLVDKVPGPLWGPAKSARGRRTGSGRKRGAAELEEFGGGGGASGS